MFSMKYIYCFIVLHSIVAIPQLNLYYTDWVNQSDELLQHTCLRVVPYLYVEYGTYEILSYCMSEWPLKFHIQNDIPPFPKFTFSNLSKLNITSQQLYLWSAPIDLIERYQFYLNQLSTTNDLSLGVEVFYNCTMPRFGPRCQYELSSHSSSHSSLNDIITAFYSSSQTNPISFTCYIHLQCNRDPHPSCLDWSEICDGKIDCLNGGIDEEHCWQLEINECKKDEYRCYNGQCIPQLFYRDDANVPDCVDASDEIVGNGRQRDQCYRYNEPSFGCDDMSCSYTPYTRLSIPLTSSCDPRRAQRLLEMIYSNDAGDDVSQECWSAFKCLIEFKRPEYSTCDQLCKKNECKEIVLKICPNIIFFPNVPVLFNNVYFTYKKSDLNASANFFIESLYICYNTSQYDNSFVNISKVFLNNMTCVHYEPFLPPSTLPSPQPQVFHIDIIRVLHELLLKYHLPFNYTSSICNRSNMYQCSHSSKCISIYRLMDGVRDCPDEDDENIMLINTPNVIEQLNKTYFKCHESNKYIHPFSVENEHCDCGKDESDWCEDEDLTMTHIKTNILFQHICDGFIDLVPQLINERNETDETECEQWQCNNIYTRCNREWNCPNGADENGCFLPSTLICSSKHHVCVSPKTNQFTCLPIEKVNDDNVDCLGATDEPTLCRTNIQSNSRRTSYDFYCLNQTFQSCISNFNLCDGSKQCDNRDDEQFCTTNRTDYQFSGVCTAINYMYASEIERFLCDIHRYSSRTWNIMYFKINEINYSPDETQNNIKKTILSSSSIIVKIPPQHQPRCHRGLDLRVWLNNKNNITYTCLCPPNYYGNQCQYQNQRISLVIKFRALSDSRQTLFAIVISLIDDSDQRIIHSYEQFTYLSLRDCQRKFNIYLLYSTRPKNSTKNHTIHIDFYENEKFLLIYRGSVLLPVNFSFLPVHRLAYIVDIPRSDGESQSCFNKQCVHGKCIRYSNNPQKFTFCQCEQGWSGRYCHIQHKCTCSSDSLCIGISANNRSICVCRIHKFGSRCLLTHAIYQNITNSTCQNRGQAILDDHYVVPYQRFTCICPKGYSGDRCEIADNQLILSFGNDIVLSQSIFIHFIEVLSYFLYRTSIVRGSTFHTIPLRQDSITIYWPHPFHLVFIDLLNKTYYLTVFQKIYNKSSTITKMINSSDRCPHINELFNQTITELNLLRRIKYYHLPCQNQSLNLSCFYDEVHLCLCYDFEDQRRLANCFKFDHNMPFDCFGQNECENGGQCLQDRPDCPTRSICICAECFYGRRCQFSTSGFGLSLDAILGYHIIPNLRITQQPLIIKISLALTIIFIVIGFINGILCLITFKNKVIREVGCGLYLFGSSITILFTTITFGMKFFILILAQMTTISNRSFLQVQCVSLDFILRVFFHMDQWLNACVAMERAFTIIKGAEFDKRKSKKIAKYVIIFILIVTCGTSIHDPIYRRLIDEDNDTDNVKRTWCIVRYPQGLEIYNYIIHICHFFGPFLINLGSSIILITRRSHQQSTIHTHRTYREILREQFQEHKHLLIAPVVLVILILPRLIITFISKCMKSADDVWLYLIGYFISFIPSMITFVVFIIPSKFYKRQFHKTVARYRINIRRRVRLTSYN